jgi:hypothetical protein
MLVPIDIERVRCQSCKRTHALLPHCIVPYSRVPLDVHVELLSANSSAEISNLLFKYQIEKYHYKRIYINFKEKWLERLNSIPVNLQSKKLVVECFKHFNLQFMQIKQTINIAHMGNYIRCFVSSRKLIYNQF